MLTVTLFTFNPVEENTYILFNEQKDAIIIDPGCYFSEEKQKVKDFIENEGLKLVQMLNTHCHLDHVLGNQWVYETYRLELFLHQNEEQILKSAPQTAKMWGVPFDNYEGLLHFVDDNDIIKLGQSELRVILAPGHSPGSICFYNAEQKFAIGGDVLFKESIGRTDLPGGNHAALIESIRDRLFTLPDDVIIYPGHGDFTTIGYEKKHNPFLRF